MTKVISKRRGVNVTKAEHNLVMKLVKKAVRELSKKTSLGEMLAGSKSRQKIVGNEAMVDRLGS